MTSARHRVFQ